MKQLRKVLGAVGLPMAVVLALTACSVIPSQRLDVTRNPPQAKVQARAANMAPEEVVESFYGWLIDYGGYDPETDTFNNPLVDGAYKTREELAPEAVQWVEETLASFDRGGYDPFLCAQDIPTSISVGRAEISDGEATVRVATSFEGHFFTVRLVQIGGEWKIVKVVCTED
jgi:hypothetical protein